MRMLGVAGSAQSRERGRTRALQLCKAAKGAPCSIGRGWRRQRTGNDSTLEEYYHYGPGDQDITALRLGENLDDAVTLRNRMRELLESPALHRNGRFPFAGERDFVQLQMRCHPRNNAFDAMVPELMKRISLKMSLSDPETSMEAFGRLLNPYSKNLSQSIHQTSSVTVIQ
jgi:hypothetical protein